MDFCPVSRLKKSENPGLCKNGLAITVSPFDPDVILVDWTDSKREAYRKQCVGHGRDWIFQELNFLSRAPGAGMLKKVRES